MCSTEINGYISSATKKSYFSNITSQVAAQQIELSIYAEE
jgi:hypothetical protein